MRILHFIGTLRTGGAERQLTILSTAQAKIGHEVHVAFGESGPLHDAISTNAVQLHRIKKKSNRDFRILQSVHQVVTSVKPDIVQTWLPQMDVAGGLTCLTKNVPWVMSERTCRAAYRMTSTTDAARRVIGYLADAIVANSDEGSRMWTRWADRTRTYVIPNALDFDAILAAPPATRGSIGFSGPFVLAVGRLTESKNFELLLDVADEVCATTDANFIICGEGPQAPLIIERIKQMHRSDRIFLFGLRPDVWGLMKSANAFVSGSLFEGQPNAVLEAMACRCPLIVSDISAHREFLDASTALLVPPESKAGFVASIERTLANEHERSNRIEAAFKVVSSYTSTRAAQLYDLAYESVLSGRL